MTKIPRTPYSQNYDDSLAIVRRQIETAIGGLTKEAAAEWLREVERLLNKAKSDIADNA